MVRYFLVLLLAAVALGKRLGMDHFKQDSYETTTYLPYETLWFTEDIDHINRDPGTIRIRVFKVKSPNSSPKGPLIIYTGNEGPIEEFYNMTGFLTTAEGIPSHWNCNIYFIEHRYYGLSQPSPFTWQYLNTDQVLYDFADIIQQLKPTNSTPVFVFGGSYGGMLSAWMRMKYQHIVDGAIASSAPVLMGLDNGEGYASKVSSVLKGVSPYCSYYIQHAFHDIYELSFRSSLYEAIGDVFRSCSKFRTHEDIVSLNNWITNALEGAVQSNYPGSSDVDEPLPSWPANATCAPFIEYASSTHKETWSLLNATAAAMNVYYNSSGEAGWCNDITGNSQREQFGMSGWYYQICTELWCPQGTNNISDIFPPNKWNPSAFTEQCYSSYQVNPRPSWLGVNYGMNKNVDRALKYASNIAFMNGELDPWQYGCILNTTNTKLYTHIIKDGAHHTDLRAATPSDPPSVVAARQKEIDLITGWIAAKKQAIDAKEAYE